MECINLNGRNFGNKTSSLKVMHKQDASPAIGRWVKVSNATGSFSKEVTVGTTKGSQVDRSVSTTYAI